MNGLEPVFEGTTLDVDTDGNNSLTIKIDNKKLSTLLNTPQLILHPSTLCKFSNDSNRIDKICDFLFIYLFDSSSIVMVTYLVYIDLLLMVLV